MTSTTMSISEAKSKLSEAIAEVAKGTTITIVKGRQELPVAKLTAIRPEETKKINFGGLKKYGEFSFADDWEMTEEEFLGL